MNAIRNKCTDGSDARVHRKGEDAEQTAFSRPFNESAETVSHRPSAAFPADGSRKTGRDHGSSF